MDPLHLIILSLVQGITEFLPVSSSAHLILVSQLTTWQDQGLVFDVAVHCGTLFAVVFHYRATLFYNRPSDESLFTKTYLYKMLVIGSIPLFICAYLFADFVSAELRSTTVIAIATISFALLLWYADLHHKPTKRALNWQGLLLIGCAQAISLIPGTSRAGITLTVGLLLGLSRTQAIHVSFLLAIPAIAGSSIYTLFQIAQLPSFDMWPHLVAAFLIATVFALLTIRLFLKLVAWVGLLPFIIYRLVLGLSLLIFI